MAAKFRGGSDDWLDNESESKREGAKKSPNNKFRELAFKEGNATVAEVFPNQSRVRFDDGRELLCNYRKIGLMPRGVDQRSRAPVCVGDRVKVEGDVIVGRCERRNVIARPAPDKHGTILQTIAANIDCLVIVTSTHKPDFNPGMVDRFLIAASAQSIEPIICLNKMDLLESAEPCPCDLYEELGYRSFKTCAKTGTGVPALVDYLNTKSAVFCGPSGVGKTSLLNQMLPEKYVGRTGDVSDSTSKGRHTTTGAILLRSHTESAWVDTPGVREFGVVDVKPELLQGHFPEILAAAGNCQIAGCLHVGEEGCGVERLPRYGSYRRIFESLQAGEF